MKRKFLVAYDGSELSKQALEEAKIQMKLVPESEVHVVSVVTLNGPTTNYVIARTYTMDLAESMQPEMESMQKSLEEEGYHAHAEVLVDYSQRNPGVKVCQYAKDNEIDMIIVGSRGLGAMSQFLLGSVSNNIVHHAECKVLVVK